jgi:hypothetical protein
LNSESPSILKVLTPVRTYESRQFGSFSSVIPENSPSLSITPTTRNHVSSLINMPSPQEVPTVFLYKKFNKHEILKKKLENLRRILKKKRAVIRSLKNKKNNDKVDKNYIQQFFNKTSFPSVNSKAL